MTAAGTQGERNAFISQVIKMSRVRPVGVWFGSSPLRGRKSSRAVTLSREP